MKRERPGVDCRPPYWYLLVGVGKGLSCSHDVCVGAPSKPMTSRVCQRSKRVPADAAYSQLYRSPVAISKVQSTDIAFVTNAMCAYDAASGKLGQYLERRRA